MQFVDAYSLDLRAVKKSCAHIAQPDGRLIPFDTHNIFYRDGKARIVEKIREEIVASTLSHTDFSLSRRPG